MSTRRERAKAPNVQLNKQLVAVQESAQLKELREEKRKNLNLWVSGLFTDMAKLVFAGVIIGGVFEKVEEPLLLYGTGFIFLAVFLFVGYVFIKRV